MASWAAARLRLLTGGHLVAFVIGLMPVGRTVEADAAYWAEAHESQATSALRDMCNLAAFRSLVYRRMFDAGGSARLLGAILRRLVPGERSLEILTADIGVGTRFVHGFSIVLLAECIGERCVIFQNVTIGDSPSRPGLPRIGDCVWIFPGAVVSGRITIAHDAVIGANSVVVRDVPAGEVWAGAPARKIGEARDLIGISRHRQHSGSPSVG